MAKNMSDGMIDTMLGAVSACVTMTVCSAEPANFAGIAAVALADHVMTGGDYTLAAGDVSGRKITVAEQAAFTVDTTGTATHVVLDDGTDIVVTTCGSQALTATNTVTVSAFDLEIGTPT